MSDGRVKIRVGGDVRVMTRPFVKYAYPEETWRSYFLREGQDFVDTVEFAFFDVFVESEDSDKALQPLPEGQKLRADVDDDIEEMIGKLKQLEEYGVVIKINDIGDHRRPVPNHPVGAGEGGDHMEVPDEHSRDPRRRRAELGRRRATAPPGYARRGGRPRTLHLSNKKPRPSSKGVHEQQVSGEKAAAQAPPPQEKDSSFKELRQCVKRKLYMSPLKEVPVAEKKEASQGMTVQEAEPRILEVIANLFGVVESMKDALNKKDEESKDKDDNQKKGD